MNLFICGPQEQDLGEGENLEGGNKNAQEVRLVGSTLPLFMELLHMTNLPLDILSRTTGPRGRYGPTQDRSIRRPRALHDLASPRRKPRDDTTSRLRFPSEPHPGFEAQIQKPFTDGFEAQPTKSSTPGFEA